MRKGIWYTDGFPDGIKNATALLKTLQTTSTNRKIFLFRYWFVTTKHRLKNHAQSNYAITFQHDVVALPIHDSVIVEVSTRTYKTLWKKCV